MSAVLIVPGLHDSGSGHWQTVWQQRLPNVQRLQLRRWDQPDLQRWSDAIIEEVIRHRVQYIVAHSFGCLGAVNAIAELQRTVRAMFLVAPADPEKFGVAPRLPHAPLPVPGLVVGSLNDPWLTWPKAQLWAQRWELPIYCAGDAGHINVQSGHGEWPEGWALLQRLLQIGKAAPAARRAHTIAAHGAALI